GRFRANATRTQIEDRFLVELSDGGAVRALDVVRVDFQLRLGVYGGVFRQKQIFVRLLGIGFLCLGTDINPPMKNTAGTVVEDAVEILVAVAEWLRMFDEHPMIG